jgi:hypothetical protein
MNLHLWGPNRIELMPALKSTKTKLDHRNYAKSIYNFMAKEQAKEQNISVANALKAISRPEHNLALD